MFSTRIPHRAKRSASRTRPTMRCSMPSGRAASWAVIDPATRGIKSRLPTIEDAAKFYKAKAGVPVDKFLETAKGFTVGQQAARRRRGFGSALSRRSARPHHRGERQSIDCTRNPPAAMISWWRLVKWLVAKESKIGFKPVIGAGGPVEPAISMNKLLRNHPRIWISAASGGPRSFFLLPIHAPTISRVLVSWKLRRRSVSDLDLRLDDELERRADLPAIHRRRRDRPGSFWRSSPSPHC